MFGPLYGSHMGCVATPVMYYNFSCVHSIPDRSRISRPNRYRSCSTLILNTLDFRPLPWSLVQKLNDRPVSSSSLVGHSISRSTLGTNYLQIYHKRSCGYWWRRTNGKALATRSSTFLCYGKHSRWQPLKLSLRTWLSLFRALFEVSRQLRFFQKHYRVYVFWDSNSAPRDSLIKLTTGV